MISEDYLDVNRKLWDEKTIHHLDTVFYDVKGFLSGKTALKHIELAELGSVEGKSLLHLQCHFGLDTLSWARLGADVTGIDLSPKAIDEARKLAHATGLGERAQFVCSDVYSLPENLSGKYDIVFTSYGTIGWLPDLDRWAKVVAHFLKPGGIFYMVDFHPFIWMYNPQMTEVEYSYFNTGPIEEVNAGTYADKDAPMEMKEYGWNHPTSELLTALLHNGLKIESFHEFPFSTWNCFLNMQQVGEEKFVFPHLGDKIPYMFSLRASR